VRVLLGREEGEVREVGVDRKGGVNEEEGV
jgi:hypothetical protein